MFDYKTVNQSMILKVFMGNDKHLNEEKCHYLSRVRFVLLLIEYYNVNTLKSCGINTCIPIFRYIIQYKHACSLFSRHLAPTLIVNVHKEHCLIELTIRMMYFQVTPTKYNLINSKKRQYIYSNLYFNI